MKEADDDNDDNDNADEESERGGVKIEINEMDGLV